MKRIRAGRLASANYYLIAVNLFLLTCLRAKGATDGRVEVCEFEDANLLFPNTPVDYVGDIRAKTWNKENGILLASWMASTNFVTSTSYEDRLMAIGENSIKIRNATRSDAGTYTLVLTSGSTQNFIEFLVDLEVLVSPSYQCVPNITREGDSLMVELPSECCGIPSLTPRWINRTQNLIHGNINVLTLDSDVGQELYIACAVGESRRCFQGDDKHLCANYTREDIEELGTTNESKSEEVTKILISLGIISTLIAVCVSLACYLRRKMKRNQFRLTARAGVQTTDIPSENHALIQVHTSYKGLTDIKRHLIDQYRTMPSVAFSPFGEGNFVDLSEVYFDLEITSQLIEDIDGKGNVGGPTASLKDIFCIDERNVNTAENNRPIPAVILGKCGIGKSTWCRNIVHEWCNYHDDKKTNVKVEDANIPQVAKFEILFFVPLQNKLKGSSFVECLKTTLFHNATRRFKYTMKYISKHRDSVLVIVDGLDAVTDNLEPIVNLLKLKDIFPCTIVLTSRPEGLISLQEKEEGALRLFKIIGMPLDRAHDYARKVLSLNQRDEQTVDQYWSFIRDLQVQILCQVPFIGLSLVIFWMDRTTFTGDMTDILLTIIECHIRRAMTRRWFKDNIGRVLKSNDFDISKYITKIKDKQFLRENGYLLKVISTVAEKIWSLQAQNNTYDQGIEIGNVTTVISEDCVQLGADTGILIKTFKGTMAIKGTHIVFSDIILFDFFVALSFALGKQDSSSRCKAIQEAPTGHHYIIRMLQELTCNTGQEICISGDHSAKVNANDTSKESNDNVSMYNERT